MAEPTTWIKLDRNITDWRWYKDPNTKAVFLHLLLTANVKDHDFQSETIHRGEVATSIGHLAQAVGISYSQARTAISRLIGSKEIASRTRPKYLVITVLGYDKYQNIARSSHDPSQPNRKQIASTSQQYKNIRREEDKNNIYGPQAETDTNQNVTAPRSDYGGVWLTDAEYDDLEAMVSNKGEFIEVLDRVGEWLVDNPRPKNRHKSVVKTFLRNDGLI